MASSADEVLFISPSGFMVVDSAVGKRKTVEAEERYGVRKWS